MKILIFQKPADHQLCKGMTIAYPVSDGWKAGEIEEVTDQDGQKLFVVGGGTYAANELRPIIAVN